MARFVRNTVAGLALALAAPAMAQQQDFSKVEIKTQMIAPGVGILFGEGGNIGVSAGPDGLIIIDDQFAPLTPRIQAALKRIEDRPVRFVINTHLHFDHTGGNENFGKAGAVIVAHDNVRKRMSGEQFMRALNRTVPPAPAAALPVVTFSEDMSLHLNGDTLRIVHVHDSHTDGDALIKWEKANVLHTGDVFVRYGLPFVDLSSGGSINGLIAAVGAAIEMADAETRVIPGHGALASRTDMESYRAMLVDVRDRIAAAIAAGKTLDQIKADNPAKKYYTGGFVNADAFATMVFESLGATAGGHAHH